MKARLADLGGTALVGSPTDFGRLIADETEKWATALGPSISRRNEADPLSIFHKLRPRMRPDVRFGS